MRTRNSTREAKASGTRIRYAMAGTSDGNDAQGPSSQPGPGKPQISVAASPPAIAGSFALLEELGSGSSGRYSRNSDTQILGLAKR